MSRLKGDFTLSGGASRNLTGALAKLQEHVEAIARAAGLDYFPTIFELVDHEEMSMLAAFGGFPTRYPHWRWGMEYERMSKGYSYGLQKIYEMVINTDPCYAYLLNANEELDQKLVMAHVYAHSDFFKCNGWFAGTNRKMLGEMASHAARLRHYAERHGLDAVEEFVDLCLSLENLIDVHTPLATRARPLPTDRRHDRAEGLEVRSADRELPEAEQFKLRSQRRYMDAYINPPEEVLRRQRAALEAAGEGARVPATPTRDVLGFLLEHAPLKLWEQDVLAIVREEAIYFAPQGMTKIMNEGWATFWHTRLMTSSLATCSEIVDYADHHSGTVAMSRGSLNPYKLGLELFRDIEERWDRGCFGAAWEECDDMRERVAWDTGAGLGLAKVFEVRAVHNDVSFVDAFLTEDFCRRHGFFTYEYDRRNDLYVIDSRQFGDVKRKLLFMLTNRGQPRIAVVDGNHDNRGELYLRHEHDGADLQLSYARATLANLARVWRRPVVLEAVIDGRRTLFRHDGIDFVQRNME